MKEFEIYKEQAMEAECEKEILELDNIVDVIRNESYMNIAVLGEINSGKTVLVNRLAGITVREPSILPDQGMPLCVMFGHDQGRQGYECIRTDAPGRTGLSLYELPMNAAINKEKGKPTPALETCDLVIYVVNAASALTASDLQNLKVFADRIPCIMAVNRLSSIEDTEERDEIWDFIRRKFENDFTEAIMIDMEQDSEALFHEWMKLIAELSVTELRDFHIVGLHNIAKGILRSAYEQKLDDIKSKRKVLEQQEEMHHEENTQRSIKWARLRNDFMEKRQMTQEQVSQMIEEERAKTEARLLKSGEVNRFNGEWIKKADNLSDRLYQESVARITSFTRKLTENHYQWLLTEVRLRLGKELKSEDWSEEIKRTSANFKNIGSGKYQPSLSPAAAGAVALGSLAAALLYHPLLGIPVVALGLAVFTLTSQKENKRQKDIKNHISNWCYSQYRDLNGLFFNMVDSAYEEALKALQRLADEKVEVSPDLVELNQEEKLLKEKLSY